MFLNWLLCAWNKLSFCCCSVWLLRLYLIFIQFNYLVHCSLNQWWERIRTEYTYTKIACSYVLWIYFLVITFTNRNWANTSCKSVTAVPLTNWIILYVVIFQGIYYLQTHWIKWIINSILNILNFLVYFFVVMNCFDKSRGQ